MRKKLAKIDYLMSASGNTLGSDYYQLINEIKQLVTNYNVSVDNYVEGSEKRHSSSKTLKNIGLKSFFKFNEKLIFYAEDDDTVSLRTMHRVRKDQLPQLKLSLNHFKKTVKDLTANPKQLNQEKSHAGQKRQYLWDLLKRTNRKVKSSLDPMIEPIRKLVRESDPEINKLKNNCEVFTRTLDKLIAELDSVQEIEEHAKARTLLWDENAQELVSQQLGYQLGKGVYETETELVAAKGKVKDATPPTSTFRIYNSGLLSQRDDVAITVNQKEYLRLQELGVMLNRDESFTAKLIGHLGKYRFYARKKAFQFGYKTDQTDIKEELMQLSIQRLRALQLVEAAYGSELDEEKKPAKLIAALDSSRSVFNKLKEKVEADLTQTKIDLKNLQLKPKGNLFKKNFARTKQYLKEQFVSRDKLAAKRKLQWKIDIFEMQKKGITKDLKQIEDFQAAIKHNPKSWHLHGMDQTFRLQRKTSHARWGTDRTKGSVEHWVRNRANRILVDAKYSNDLLTLTGKWTLGRGRCHSAIAEAGQLCSHYEWDQNNRIGLDHQGWFDEEYRQAHIAEPLNKNIQTTKPKQQTLTSAMVTGGKAGMRAALFAFSCVNATKKDPLQDNAIKIVTSRLLQRKSKSQKDLVIEIETKRTQRKPLSPREKIIATYLTLRETVDEANQGWSTTMTKVLRSLSISVLRAGAQLFYHAPRDVITQARKAIRRDFTYLDPAPVYDKQVERLDNGGNSDKDELVEEQKAGSDVAEKILDPDNPFFQPLLVKDKKELDKKWGTLFQRIKNNYTIKYPGEAAELQNKRYRQFFIDALKKSEFEENQLPLFVNKHPFSADFPHTVFSAAHGFADDFVSLLEVQFEKHPTIWTGALGVYSVSFVAMALPQVLTLFLLKYSKVSKTVIDNYLRVYNLQASAEDTGDESDVTSAGLINLKIAVGLLRVAADTENSAEGAATKLLEKIKEKGSFALLEMGGVYLLEFREYFQQCPEVLAFLESNIGNVMPQAYTFANFKSMHYWQDAFQVNERERSTFYNMTATILNLAVNSVRAVLSVVNLGMAGFFAIKALVAHRKNNSGYLARYKGQSERAFKNFTRPWRDLGDTLARSAASVIDFSNNILRLVGIVVKIVIKTPLEAVANLMANFIPAPLSRLLVKAKHQISLKADMPMRKLANVSRVLRNSYAKIQREETYMGDRNRANSASNEAINHANPVATITPAGGLHVPLPDSTPGCPSTSNSPAASSSSFHTFLTNI